MPDASGFDGRAIWIDDQDWDGDAIPPRDWLARGYLLRQSVTVVIGPGGASKSTLMAAYAVALALGTPLHGMKPTGRCRTMIYNVEDDRHEQQRRLSAILTSMGRTPTDIAGWVARVGPIGVGTLLDRDPITGKLRRTAAWLDLVNEIVRFAPDVLILDPLAELHADEENANIALREIVAEFRALANERSLALVLVHHTRKGQATPGDMDSARGASSIVSAARIVLTVSTMDEVAAEAFGIPIDRRKHFFRLDGAKSNYSVLTDAEWFERQSYDIGTQGDTVAVPIPWHPPSNAVSMDTRLAIERAVEKGSGAGPWSAKLSDDPRSVRRLFEMNGIRATKAQKDALAALLAKGFVDTQFRKSNRVPAMGLRSPNGEPSSAAWMDVPDA